MPATPRPAARPGSPAAPRRQGPSLRRNSGECGRTRAAASAGPRSRADRETRSWPGSGSGHRGAGRSRARRPRCGRPAVHGRRCGGAWTGPIRRALRLPGGRRWTCRSARTAATPHGGPTDPAWRVCCRPSRTARRSHCPPGPWRVGPPPSPGPRRRARNTCGCGCSRGERPWRTRESLAAGSPTRQAACCTVLTPPGRGPSRERPRGRMLSPRRPRVGSRSWDGPGDLASRVRGIVRRGLARRPPACSGRSG